LPETVKRIEKNAFRRCVNLETIVLPESVLRIEEDAFESCGLKCIVIPEAVNYIAETAFDGCYDLIICAPYDSYAASYARRCGIKHVYTEDVEEMKKNPPSGKKPSILQRLSKKWEYTAIVCSLLYKSKEPERQDANVTG